jgi:hypothetical protein
MTVTTRWSPWLHLREHHPDFRVHEVELPTGLMGCLDHLERRIWLDTRLTDVERDCTLAHELGHLALDTLHAGVVLTAAEWKVDRWAAVRLLPIRTLARAFTWAVSISEVADEVGVDEHTLRTRLRCLTDDEQDAVMEALERMRVA